MVQARTYRGDVITVYEASNALYIQTQDHKEFRISIGSDSIEVMAPCVGDQIVVDGVSNVAVTLKIITKS